MTNIIDNTTSNTSSPASIGPAGALFEVQVGAHYLLTMLAGSEPRGLAGTVISSVEFQRESDGRPLDDVIIHATNRNGTPAVLEIQAKRTVDFTPSDSVFKSVVKQVAKAATLSEFDANRYELAVAIERTSTKIERVYQEVLSWARSRSSSDTFAAHIKREGYANKDMSKFVETFRNNLKLADAPHDDAAVWRILRRFQILVFDFNQRGSTYELLARERVAGLLSSKDRNRAPDLWNTLTSKDFACNAKGGDYNAVSLREELSDEFGYCWAGDRQLTDARRIIDESSTGALADIKSQVGAVHINRGERLTEIYSALDVGRFVEIRGDAGVGKSGILKQLAKQIRLEGRAVVLSPDRTIPGGWQSVRAELGCNASAREFLSDLASDGGAFLFIDGVDFFEDESKRVTVRDFVRAAAEVSNFSIVVTARQDFGVDDPSWLFSESFNDLGQVQQVLVNDLNESEITQLKTANSTLAALLSDTHPARDVVRNLFRLAYLVRCSSEPVPLTEADMAAQWWKIADGAEKGRRERSRLLKQLAIHALTENEPKCVAPHDPTAIESLISTGSIRELRTDYVVFQHDIFRDWAIGCLLREEPNRINELRLDCPAPARLIRGVEFAARIVAESSTDGKEWKTLIDRLSQDNVHGSWRRAALLAVVRSELGVPLLDRVSDHLLVHDGELLRDLIRLTIAIDSTPGAKAFDSVGVDPGLLPDNFLFPKGLSWCRLISWSLGAISHIPKAIIPDLFQFYSLWSMSMFGHDHLTPSILAHFYSWLVKIESVSSLGRINDFENKIRSNFLLFCHRTPELAEQYLYSVAKREPGDQVARNIMRFNGSAIRVAPAAFLDLTLHTFIPAPDDDEDIHKQRDLRGAFGFYDIDFMPASPDQGPFFELLKQDSKLGLRLIREIVAHIIKHYTKGRDCGTDHFTIPFPDGGRSFPWCQSYNWARVGQSYIVTSALMALEAWSHRRIEDGQPFDDVLSDILGTSQTPAAFLLVAVDLLLSHWPKSKDYVGSFLACPELLSHDHARYSHDFANYNDITETSELSGAVTLKTLHQYSSRRGSLCDFIGKYAVGDYSEILSLLQGQLLQAAKRLDRPSDDENDMRYPRFMAMHAVNLANPTNWEETTGEYPDGTQKIVYQYKAPSHELALIESGQNKTSGAMDDTILYYALADALVDKDKSSPGLVAKGVTWAQINDEDIEKSDDYDPTKHARTKMIAAALVMRDGDDTLRTSNVAWVQEIFADILASTDGIEHRPWNDLTHDAVAIAAVGLINLLLHHPESDVIATILEIAAHSNQSMALAFGAEYNAINDIDKRLPRSILRVGFAACIYALPNYDESKDAFENRKSAHRQRIRTVLEQEIVWLDNGQTEPAWPKFPDASPPPEPGDQQCFQVSASDPRLFVPCRNWKRPLDAIGHQSIVLWLSMLIPIVNTNSRYWLRKLVKSYAAWTAINNGVGFSNEDRAGHDMREWNAAYFKLIARTMVGLSPDEIDEFALDRIVELPDVPCYFVMSEFIRTVDELYFNDGQIDPTEAVRIRSRLAKRLVHSRNWRWVIERNSSNIETQIAPAIAAFFMHSHDFRGTHCHLYTKDAERLNDFIPILEDLTVRAARSSYVAGLFLTIIEVRVQPQHLEYLVKCLNVWFTCYPDDSAFWADHEFGKRVCAWLDEVIHMTPNIFLKDPALKTDLDRILDAMVRNGVSQARAIEDVLGCLQTSKTDI